MVTLADAIKEAVAAGPAERGAKIAQVADFMRFHLGMNYQQSFNTVKKVLPNMTLAEWDSLLREADEEPIP